jgi:hypothetical protein
MDKRARQMTMPPPPTPTTSLEESFRHGSWHVRRAKILAGLTAAGYPTARIERFRCCGSQAYVEQEAESGALRVRASYCKDRWCQPCSRARVLNMADNLAGRLAGDSHLHIVLTTKHTRSPLVDQVTAVFKNFARLRSKRFWKQAVDGGATFLQVHVGETDGLWHVHLHTIARGKWLDARTLSAEWLKVTGDSSNVHVSRVDGDARVIREVTRYAAKPVDGDTTDDPDALAELMRALNGRHLCFTWGKWRGWKLTAQRPDDRSKTWNTIGRLDDLAARAQAGEEHAKIIITLLLTKKHPANAPPRLFPEPEPCRALLASTLTQTTPPA